MFIAEQDLSPMMSGQRTFFVCPTCKTKSVLFVTPRQLCSTCKNRLPDLFKLRESVEYRKDYYMGILAVLRVVK